MTAYVLLTQYKLGLIVEGVKLMKWLSQQRNDRGGFRGTQVRLRNTEHRPSLEEWQSRDLNKKQKDDN